MTHQLLVEDFSNFFYELSGQKFRPYPWQQRLCEKVLSAGWPTHLNLPTGAGKTSVLEIAVFTLACEAAQGAKSPEKRHCPTRIFFVIDRRIVVDEADSKANRLATNLQRALEDREFAKSNEILVKVAENLLTLAKSDGRSCDVRPLEVHTLRGGFYRTNEWASSLVQPTIVTSTVDQIGSRLLFRGYGISPRARPLQAALIGSDSLLILDEAHTAAAMASTVETIVQYQKHSQACKDDSIPVRPVQLVQMTATLPAEPLRELNIFQLDPTTDLNADGENSKLPLVRAYHRPKPVALFEAKASGKHASKQLAKELLGRVNKRLEKGEQNDAPEAIAVVVNRIATAKQLYYAIRSRTDIEHHLMIGQMRPLDRDRIGRTLGRKLGTGKERNFSKPIVVVATQCLEVGADLDFDYMITEAASIDALRQRFGRLNRAGRDVDASGEIHIRSDQYLKLDAIASLKSPADADPVYGPSLARTFHWLKSIAANQEGEDIVDFGLHAMDERWQKTPAKREANSSVEEWFQNELLIAQPQKALLMPSHVQLLSQTYAYRRNVEPEVDEAEEAPNGEKKRKEPAQATVAPDPDVSLFLHGRQQRSTDVQICWRGDLCEFSTPIGKNREEVRKDDSSLVFSSLLSIPAGISPTGLEIESEERMVAAVSEMPPTSPECMSVGWRAVKQFLLGQDAVDDADQAFLEVNSEPSDKYKVLDQRRPVVWRGPDDSFVCYNINQLRPGDTLVFPTSAGGWSILGHMPGCNIDPAAESVDMTREEVRTQIAGIDVADVAAMASTWQLKLRVYPWLATSQSELADLGKNKSRQWAPMLAETLEPRATGAEVKEGKSDDYWESIKSSLPPFCKVLLEEWLNSHKSRATHRSSCCGMLLDRRGMRLNKVDVQRLLRSCFANLGTQEDGSVEREIALGDLGFVEEYSSESSIAVSLLQHSYAVSERAVQIAKAIGFEGLAESYRQAGLLHDLGKADPRFQALLDGSSVAEAWLHPKLLAKSRQLATSSKTRARDRERSGLPPGFRHELVSSQIVQQLGVDANDLVLHLLEAHHGYARPWFPAWLDRDPQTIDLHGVGIDFEWQSQDRNEGLDTQARVDAAERFLSLQERYGAWSTALLEAVLRIADQQVSADEQREDGKLKAPAGIPKKIDLIRSKSNEPSNPPPLSQSSILRLEGLDGSNPLAFLASLGLLRLLDSRNEEASLRMHWEVEHGQWIPVLTSTTSLFTDTWIGSELHELATRELNGAIDSIDDGSGKIITDPDRFWRIESAWLQKYFDEDASQADGLFLSSLANEMSRRIELGKETDTMEFSELYMTRGSGHQRMLELAKNIRNTTQSEHLRKALFEPWRYDDDGKSLNLRWDPLDDRQYAKRWLNPSTDPSQTVLGGNDLAFEALPFFPTAIVNRRLETTAFQRRRRMGTFLTWPIWTAPMRPAMIASLLTWSEMHAESADSLALQLLSISHRYRVERVRNDKFFNFSNSAVV